MKIFKAEQNKEYDLLFVSKTPTSFSIHLRDKNGSIDFHRILSYFHTYFHRFLPFSAFLFNDLISILFLSSFLALFRIFIQCPYLNSLSLVFLRLSIPTPLSVREKLVSTGVPLGACVAACAAALAALAAHTAHTAAAGHRPHSTLLSSLSSLLSPLFSLLSSFSSFLSPLLFSISLSPISPFMLFCVCLFVCPFVRFIYSFILLPFNVGLLFYILFLFISSENNSLFKTKV